MKLFRYGLVFFLVVSYECFALEIDTHAVITYKAFQKTIIDTNLLLDWDIQNNSNAFGNTYYDVSDAAILVKKNDPDYEDKIIRKNELIKQSPLSIQGWLMRGVIREDDVASDDSGVRVVNHFFDPYFDRPLTVNFVLDNLFTPIKAPNWILGTKDAFTAPLTPLPEDSLKYNHYTVFSAMDAMYRALTGHDKTGSPNIGPDGIIGDEAVRNAYWATTFRALGDLVHIIQDMSQPQHTRNDYHGPGATFPTTAFEAYTNARATGVNFECAPDDDLLTPPTFHTPPVLKFTLANNVSYPIPPFTKYGDFFSTQRGAQVVNGLGLADYSNSNFFSAGTNLGMNDYPSPPNDIADLSYTHTEYTLTNPCILAASPLTKALERNTKDNLNPTLNEIVAVSTQGLWSVDISDVDEAVSLELQSSMALTRINYEAMADNLIPRAIAYSAGLINHFFRGRLDVTKSEQSTDTSGNAIVAITIKNTSTQSFHMTNGKLEIFYDAIVDGEEVRKSVQMAQGETGNITELRNSTETTLKIILPTDIDTTKENPFIVVYKGVIGEEPGVAGKVFSIKEETAILLFYEQGGSNDLLVKRSVDEGKTWKNVDAVNFAGFKLYPNSRGYQLLPSGKGRGLLVGYNSTGIFTLRTTDNGNSWATHLEQEYEQYTQVLNVIKAIHAGDGRLITYNNIYSGSYKVGTRTYYTYDVELSESFDDGENWTPLGFSVDVQGRGVQLYYLGNQHLYLLTSSYNTACDCVTSTWYESFDSGENFSKALFSPGDLEWQPSWYRDAYSFDNEQIVTIKNTSIDSTVLEYNFAISSDGGKTITVTDSAAKNVAWPQAEPIHIRPIGQGKFISYVFDPWTAYEKDHENYYEGILVSNDKGQNWTEMYQGTLTTWNGPWYLMMGVLTKDNNNLKYIH